MEWFYNFTDRMAVKYVAYKTGIVFATAVGGYLATVLIQKLKQRLSGTAAITNGRPPKRKKKRRRRRKHKPIKYPNSLSSDSSSSSSSSES